MDMVKSADGHRRFMVGPVELAIVASIPIVLMGWFAWNWNKAMETIGDQGKAMATITTQLAVLQDNVLQLRVQLADVPGLAQRVSRLEVVTDAHTEQLRELRQVKGLR